MGPRCSSAETQVCHRSYIIAANTRPASLLERAVMLEISILTVLLYETCIVIRKSSHVRAIDSDCVAMRDLHRY